MRCANCRVDIPDGSNFCAQCGKPQSTTREHRDRAKIAAWAVVLVVLCIICAGLIGYGARYWSDGAKSSDSVDTKPTPRDERTNSSDRLAEDQAAARYQKLREPPNTFRPNGTGLMACVHEYGTSETFGSGISHWRPRDDGRCYWDDEPARPLPHVVPITNGAIVVNAGSYSWYTLIVPPNVTTVNIMGRFTASGGSGNDTVVYILDEDGFVNFKNGHPANTYYNSGKVTQANIAAVLPDIAATYYLVFDNRFSAITPKAVQVNAVLRYMQ